MKIASITFGCRLNKAESAQLEAQLLAASHELVHAPAEADAIIVRGCSVTAKAQKECENLIERLRYNYSGTPVYVVGCLPGAIARPESLKPKLGIPRGGETEDFASRIRSARAFLKVQDGCNLACTFCIVPQFRGKSKSGDFDGIVAKARALAEAGFTEIVLTGCNLAQYRSKRNNLVRLVKAILAAGDTFRVRLGSVEPGLLDDALLELYESEARVCRFLHLSVQSASNGILKAMQRPYPVEKLNAFCDQFRAIAPDAALGADIICGFPGESDEDFAQTRRFLELWNFTNVHAFPYSERPGTVAATMAGAIPPKIRSKRTSMIIADAARRLEMFKNNFIGRDVEVCIEKNKNGVCEGWTSEYLRAQVHGDYPRRALVRIPFHPAGY